MRDEKGVEREEENPSARETDLKARDADRSNGEVNSLLCSNVNTLSGSKSKYYKKTCAPGKRSYEKVEERRIPNHH